MSDYKMTGRVEVWLSTEGEAGARRLAVSVSGLPGWVLGMLRDSAPLTNSGSTYSLDAPDKTGPHNVTLRGARLFVSVDDDMHKKDGAQ